jgi:tRNA pseudouridine55 synthase
MYNGVINVYKEKGFTSFDVVAKLRGILHQKKIGHTGTLDPDAEGVLVVCLGSATKLCDILTDKDKSYEATLLLGKTSDTEDSSGNVLSEQEVRVSEQQVREAIMSFVGEYEQVPPMYSAIKVNGKKLYELAREGVSIERTPRPVVVHSIEILSVDLPRVRMKISCGKGTYIRSLCRDIGERLGCGGLMESLVRDSVNSTETGKLFTKEASLSLNRIEELVKNHEIENYIMPVDSMFPKLARVKVQRDGEKKLANGNILKNREIILLSETEQENVTDLKELEQDGIQCLVYGQDGQFKAIYQYSEKLKAWKAEKMFLS